MGDTLMRSPQDTQILAPGPEGTHVDLTSYFERLRAMAPISPSATSLSLVDQLREGVRMYGIRLEEVETQGIRSISPS